MNEYNSYDDNVIVKNPFVNIGPYQLSVSVSNYESKMVNKDNVIYYKVDLYSYLTNNEWQVFRRYNDFYELYLVLEKFFIKIPKFPGKSLTKVKNIDELNKRKENLNEFLNNIILRPDLISNIYVIKFLLLENHFPDFKLFQPLLLYCLEDLPQQVTTFYYHKKTSLLFVGLSELKTDGPINNIIKLFQNQPQRFSKLLVYNIIKNNSGEQHFELLCQKIVKDDICYLNYFESNSILAAGFGNGTIELFKVYINESSDISKELIEELCFIKAHKKKVIGIAINFLKGYVYSFAKDTSIVISEMNHQSILRNVPISKKEFSCIYYDERKLRCFATDDGGSIWIIDLYESLQPKVLQGIHTNIGPITALEVDLDKNIFFVGSRDGNLHFYEFTDYIVKNNNFNIFKKLELDLGNVKITSIKYNSKNEIIVGMGNGSVSIFSNNEENPEFILDLHLKEICNIFWDESKKMLLTASHDKSIKLYQFPAIWPSEMISKSKNKKILKIDLRNDDTGFIPIMSTSDELKIDENYKELSEFEIYSDDLNGWDNE